MNIIVLCGGLSMERDVSLVSGSKIAEALRARGHKAVLVDSFMGYTGEYSDPSEIFEMPYNDSDFCIGDDAPNLEEIKKSRKQNSSWRLSARLR